MKIIVPMAGRGSRLRPQTFITPKPLVNVAGKPILEQLLNDLMKLIEEPVQEIVFIIGPPIIFSRSTPHSRHLRRPSRHVAPSRISANGVVLHCEIIAHYTFPCPAHWARSRRSASIAPRSSRRPRTRHVPRSRTRDETRTASTYRCEPPRSSTKCASQRANGGE